MIKADIDRDLKTAMLSGDKRLVEVLRSLKSAILYREVADGKREEGLDEPTILQVLKKEQKSRKDAIDLYTQAGEAERAAEEQYQIDVISGYLPEQMSEQKIAELVDEVIKDLKLTVVEQKNMGSIIAEIKKRVSNADGAMVAKAVRERISS